MTRVTAYEMFEPVHIAWLHRRHPRGLDVMPSDLDSILAHMPGASVDALYREYRARQAAGKLHKKRGRKPMTCLDYLRLWAARFEIEEEVARIKSGRSAGMTVRGYGDDAPCVQAAEIVARRFRYGSGRALLNQHSKLGISARA
ncbi:hypothetical protein [Qipengyuania sp. DGS5-3]|uniref:hypothetical protein n=1 Tax=Qipengyuania sp. DGS5-3 TaxID=3349632 RepID=UPI0036D3A143